MKILRIVTRLNRGGPSLHVTALTKEFNNDKNQSLLVFGKSGFYEGNMYEELQGLEKRKHYFYVPTLQREIQWEMDLYALLSIIKLVKYFKPDVIHTHMSKAGFIGRVVGMMYNFFYWWKWFINIVIDETYWKGRKKIKLVHTYHGHTFHDYWSTRKTRWLLKLERWLNLFTDKVIVISKQQKEEICDVFKVAGKHKTIVVPLGFDLTQFRCSPPTKIRNIGIVGRLVDIKNHEAFINMVAYLVEVGKHFNYYIVGDGPLRTKLMRYVWDMGLSYYVTFTSWQEDRVSIYDNLDIVVCTSLNEGTPVALIEAMASGKVVVSTDVGGVRDMGLMDFADVMHDEMSTGIIVPVGEPEQMAKVIMWVDNNIEKCNNISKHARQFVLRQYNIKRLVSDLKEVYES